MKKLLLPFFVFLCLNASSQTWFDLGLKGGVGSGFLLNKTLNDDGRFGVTPGFNYFYGGKVGINFGEYVGITFDVDYGSYSYGFTQAEVPGKTNTLTYKYKLAYNSVNLMPMIRYTKEASYVELGPQFSFVKNPIVEDEAYPTINQGLGDRLNNQLTGIVFGFGGHMIGNETISLMMGLRLNYVFSNLTSDVYENTPFPFSNYPSITASSKTNPINIQLVFELNYSLGYFVKASCGKRTAFLTF
jgi:hypothetical protein